MRRSAPVGLLVSTVAVVVIVNLIVAQIIIVAFYPGAGTRLGLTGLIALVVGGVVCALYTVRGWRAYLRRPPDVGSGC